MMDKKYKPMLDQFWEDKESIAALYDELKQDEGNPNASFWDIIVWYEPDYRLAADISKRWLRKQDKLIAEIMQTYFMDDQLDFQEICLIYSAILGYLFPYESQRAKDELDSKFRKIAKKIALEYIEPLYLVESTTFQFMAKLRDELTLYNKDYFNKVYNEELLQSSLSTTEDPKQREEIIRLNTRRPMEAYYEMIYSLEELKASDPFRYHKITLTMSMDFLGIFGDIAVIPHEGREKVAQEKFEQYSTEISNALDQLPDPDPSLQPRQLDFTRIDVNFEYDKLVKRIPFVWQLGGKISIWKDKERMIFLSMDKIGERRETSRYLINMGGLTLKKYREVLEKYNAIADLVN